MFAATLLLFLAFAIAVPFAATQLPEFNAFVPTASAVMSINDLITSALLYSHCSIVPSRSFLVLAGGYLFTALIILPHALAFPGAFATSGLIGATLQTSPWLYFSAHFVFSAVLLSYAWLKDVDRLDPLQPSSAQWAIGISASIALAFACSLTWITTVGGAHLPPILSDRAHALRVHLVTINGSIIGITAIALMELWRRRRTVLDYWLMLICVALIQEEVFFLLAVDRFTLGFYVGRMFWLFTSIVVLILLLQETAKLYSQLAHSCLLLERERDNKLLNAKAITASIAHEVRQPLTAIVATCGAALEYLKRSPPNNEKARLALDKIIAESHRTSDLIDGIRALFDRDDQKLESIDFNEIVKGILDSLRIELMVRGVTTLSEFAELPPIEGRRNQLEQVVFNLVHNALEAMDAVTNRPRRLLVKTECRRDSAVALVLADSGPGINSTQLESIFHAFVTTKPHGMGLGLAICQQIVEQHGGQLVASSDAASGAEFQVILPVLSRGSTAAQS